MTAAHSLSSLPKAAAPPGGIEWPTLVLAAAIHAGWLVLTWVGAALPLWALAPLGGWLVAWHGSLQHETIHGHPTASPWINATLGSLPLALWLPYRHYRREHVAHHAAEHMTHPASDPESRYLLPARRAIDGARHLVARLQAPLVGRLLIGPPVVILGFLAGEAHRAIRRPAATLRDWAPHLLGLVLIAGWLAVCHLSLGRYLLAFVYPGTALSLLRSFAEHRAAPTPGHRVAIVECAGPLALLFLNNNLHAAHHRAPGVAWFRLPAYYGAHRVEILRDNGGLSYRGYREIVARYAFRAHDRLVHPAFDTTAVQP